MATPDLQLSLVAGAIAAVITKQETQCEGRFVGVDADVVDEQFCGEFCGGVGGLGPVAACGEVEQEEDSSRAGHLWVFPAMQIRSSVSCLFAVRMGADATSARRTHP